MSKDQEVAVPISNQSWWTRVLFSRTKVPPPPPASLDDALLIPEANANSFSRIVFEWITPLLRLGFARPLEASDLWKLQDDRGAQHIARLIAESYERRTIEARVYNERIDSGEIKPVLKPIWWSIRGNKPEKMKEWREKAKKRPSLVWAMNDSVKWWFWSAGLFKVIGDVAQVTSPLVVKEIIIFATQSYIGHHTGLTPVPHIGKGIGLAFTLFALQIISSICSNHFFYRSTSTGVLLRGGLIAFIYNRSLKLTSRSRSVLTNGKLVNHISTDVSRIDFCAGFFHMSWSSPIPMLICLALLIIQMGPSALAGFAVFVILSPFQVMVMKQLFKIRGKGMVWTDKRVKLVQELLGGMKIIKFFSWEIPYLERLANYRKTEIAYTRLMLLIRSANSAVAISMPTIAAVIAFVTYSLTGHPLDPAIIFTSLTLFNLLRMPLMLLPLSLGTITDAKNATERLRGVFEAELLDDTYTINESINDAIEVKNASFTWDAPAPDTSDKASKKKSGHGNHPAKRKTGKPKAEDTTIGQSPEKEDRVFQLNDVTLTVPRGQLVAIVGPVGSGKSSLLQGLIGEMRRTSGNVVFGGSVGYCPQIPWIQNATIRENICFGRPFEEDRYWKAVRESCLLPDLAILPNGDFTEVGEKGISLSGGQKQRVSICRLIYSNADIQIFDDPLSALDAHVGKKVFEDVLREGLKGRTRILVTHALHFLSMVDFVYVLEEGKIREQGKFDELMASGGAFAKFVAEFGSSQDKKEEETETVAKEVDEDDSHKNAAAGQAMMQAEERNTGAVTWDIYKAYIKAARGGIVLPFLIFSILLMQGSNIVGSYWLVWWQERTFNQPQGFYMGVYAALGVAQALSFFLLGASTALATYFSSQRLHKSAITQIIHAPMSFFDTTPLGRIMNRFSKDIDNIDNQLGESFRMFLATFSGIFGGILLISIVIPWFLIGAFVVMFLYAYSAAFYRSSARELKRLDAVLRSSLYSHFSETLSGLATIRAYGETKRFQSDNEGFIDVENRAYWLTVVNQRWLGVRLDFLGGLLTLIVAMLSVGARFTISPSQTGLILAYVLGMQQTIGWTVRQLAEVENNMNSVERLVYYSQDIEQEAPYEIPSLKPPPSWPTEGRLEFKDVSLCYRPGLPAVLKGISMSVKDGEKIGIVGRTGAGKSSIMIALFRIVELFSGSITIDGVDISKIGLADLRRSLSIIPQDPLLFSGTLRSNLDPFNLHDDAALWDALKRANLVGSSPFDTPSVSKESTSSHSHGVQDANQFNLDTIIEDEGNNLSVGQRSLVSLARAFVKNSKLIVMDEATASVDYETDHIIQETISREFHDRTILCIAHRLRTIISYDRICVLDGGQIAELDTPANLYQNPNSIFRGMCERSSITLQDILQSRKDTLNV